MTDSDRAAFLAGDRPEDVLIYLDEAAVSNPDALEAHGERVDDGLVLVLPGDKARSVFQKAAGIDPMAFAKEAMGTEGHIDADCTGGTCPEGDGDDHQARFVFAFAEEQNEEVGDLYAEGDVVHAYVSCSCGTAYSDKWVVDESELRD
ncbi:DUF5807 family protein [Salinibaculum rarum]|uniref:DUF5807 family protein n=1 Tax=Salinibaculum rarum TaxID=3058903 RepID=UPI00266055CC|nr:DUF5807 family protein [Salinibaculum sp. KK48]